MEKYGTARQATDDNITRLMHTAYWIPKATNTQYIYIYIYIYRVRQRIGRILSFKKLKVLDIMIQLHL